MSIIKAINDGIITRNDIGTLITISVIYYNIRTFFLCSNLDFVDQSAIRHSRGSVIHARFVGPKHSEKLMEKNLQWYVRNYIHKILHTHK